ncbi:MAG TPA: CopG family transcriptional regulator [Frateuria sp.]|uniref:ribbon-helix-helix domain-containing protein n=1 Tax=Frateuria sp. TaxID=2211372 RepID=UPI002DF5D94B|nr:CopG family transcriptional regulator [Frateuria sp.]
MQKTRVVAKPRIGTEDITRATVSFPADIYAELERIAATKKVSVAWVVREAAERYVAGEADPPAANSRSRK